MMSLAWPLFRVTEPVSYTHLGFHLRITQTVSLKSFRS